MLFHHKLQTRNHGDTPHKKDLMMLMIERFAMVAIEVLRSQQIQLVQCLEYSRKQKRVSISKMSHFETIPNGWVF